MSMNLPIAPSSLKTMQESFMKTDESLNIEEMGVVGRGILTMT
jgi:hypothetical protein